MTVYDARGPLENPFWNQCSSIVLYMTVSLKRDVIHSPNALIYDFLETDRSGGMQVELGVVCSARRQHLVQRHNVDSE